MEVCRWTAVLSGIKSGNCPLREASDGLTGRDASHIVAHPLFARVPHRVEVNRKNSSAKFAVYRKAHRSTGGTDCSSGDLGVGSVDRCCLLCAGSKQAEQPVGHRLCWQGSVSVQPGFDRGSVG
jgi:hypothetical protein